MTYLEQLTKERKDRLKRLNAGPPQNVSCKTENSQSENVQKPEPENKSVHEIPITADDQKIAVLQAQVRELRKLLETKNAILPQVEPPAPAAPSVAHIKRIIAAFYMVSVLDLESHRKQVRITRPRQIAMHLAARVTLRSVSDIGRQFGGRDHSTALHARNKIERQRQEDPDFDAELLALEAKITA